ncbi:hypothetical protein WJX84_002285 [Apatococcus fuscideae]|uniref:Uncharacterized protein n=1 Tax=Apatococcus fuscideae TaxID=2026836 RepID=A0AAW1SVD3_9CHLO
MAYEPAGERRRSKLGTGLSFGGAESRPSTTSTSAFVDLSASAQFSVNSGKQPIQHRPATSFSRPGSSVGSSRSGVSRPFSRSASTRSPGAAGSAAFSSVLQQVSGEARPFTQQGLSASRRSTPRTPSSRQVQDHRYHLSQLLHKRKELLEANSQLQADIELLERQSAQSHQLQGMVAELSHDVEDLQGELSDCNTAISYAAASVDADTLFQEAESLQQQNTVEEAALNSIVRERDQQQRQAKRATEQAQEVEQDLFCQLQQAAPQSAEHFRTLQAAAQQLQGRKEQLEGELKRVNNEINAAEDELSGQSLKQEAFALQEHLEELQGKMAALSAEEAQGPASPTAEQARLQDQIKADNAAIDEMRKTSASVASHIEQLEAEQAASSSSAAAESGQDGAESHADQLAERQEDKAAKEATIASLLHGLAGLPEPEPSEEPPQLPQCLENVTGMQVFTNHMFDRPGSMGNPLFAAGGELNGTNEAAFLAELQARAEAESKQLENSVKANRKSRRFSQVHSGGGGMEAGGAKSDLKAAMRALEISTASKSDTIAAYRAQLADNPEQQAVDRLEQQIQALREGISRMSAIVQSQNGSMGSPGPSGMERLSSQIAQLNLAVQKAVTT